MDKLIYLSFEGYHSNIKKSTRLSLRNKKNTTVGGTVGCSNLPWNTVFDLFPRRSHNY